MGNPIIDKDDCRAQDCFDILIASVILYLSRTTKGSTAQTTCSKPE